MKHRIVVRNVLTVLFISLLGSGALKAQETRKLSLQEAISLSIKNSKQLKGSQAKIDEATAALREAVERRLPDAKVSGAYMRFNSPKVDLSIKSNNNNNNGGSGSSTGNTAKVTQAAYAMVNASLPIYAGGRIRYGIESSKYLEQAAKLDADNDREAVVLNTIDAYNNLYKSRAAVDLVNQNLQDARQRVKDLTNLEKNGVMARNDLLKAQLQQSNTELSLLDAENNWKLAMVNMNLMLGLPDSTTLETDSTSMNSIPETKNVQDYVIQALQNRKDLSALDLRKKAAQTGVKATRADLYPSLALTGGYVALDIPNALSVYNAVNIGLGVQYNIGSLWKTKAKIDQAEARQRQVQASEEQLADGIRMEVNQAYLNYLSSQKKIEVYNAAIEQAEENYKVTNNKFNNGLATVTDVLDADIARLQARLNRAFAQSDTYVAYNKLLQSAGLLNQPNNQQ
jgi:outer membrane protein TolC